MNFHCTSSGRNFLPEVTSGRAFLPEDRVIPSKRIVRDVFCEHVCLNPDLGLPRLDGAPHITPVRFVPPAKVSEIMQKICNLPYLKYLQPVIAENLIAVSNRRAGTAGE
jgi:hypothetical protein